MTGYHFNAILQGYYPKKPFQLLDQQFFFIFGWHTPSHPLLFLCNFQIKFSDFGDLSRVERPKVRKVAGILVSLVMSCCLNLLSHPPYMPDKRKNIKHGTSMGNTPGEPFNNASRSGPTHCLTAAIDCLNCHFITYYL